MGFAGGEGAAMTAAEWDGSVSRGNMIRAAAEQLSERVLRLFACACCRRIAHLFEDRACGVAVETAELFVVGRFGAKRLARAYGAAVRAVDRIDRSWWRRRDADPPGHSAALNAAVAASSASHATVTVHSTAFDNAAAALQREFEQAQIGGMPVRGLLRRWPFLPEEDTAPEELGVVVWKHVVREQCDLLREVAGNPFRPVDFDPGWLRWNGGWLPRLARTLYDEHRFDELPILGDALEDLGCRDEALLSHCRRPGPHVRGCWVLRLLLGMT
jgi:hypothetical protein